jgi:hypothetical protein
MEMKGKQSKMAGLFIYAAIIQGAIAALITFLGAFGDNSSLLHLYPVAVAHVIAGGEAGMWFVMGYLTYLVVGVVAMAVTAMIYFYIETVQGKVYKGIAKGLAWAHLVIGNVGVAGGSLLSMIGGYLGAAAMQPASSGGMGWTTLQVHVNILQYYSVPVAVFIGLAVLGFFLGGIGYLIAMRSK